MSSLMNSEGLDVLPGRLETSAYTAGCVWASAADNATHTTDRLSRESVSVRPTLNAAVTTTTSIQSRTDELQHEDLCLLHSHRLLSLSTERMFFWCQV